MAKAFINSKMLTWARVRASVTIGYIADKFGKTIDEIAAWESGDEPITFAQAQRFADLTRLPFGYLYLDTPPNEIIPIPDRRTVGSTSNASLSIDLRDTINDVLIKQDWYREYAQANGMDAIKIIGCLNPDSSVESIVKVIRQHIDTKIPPTKGKWGDLFRELVKKIESLGILVMRSGVVKNISARPLSVNEFRGFCIADKLAPIIFININDTKSAQLFTLIHELSHLIIGESAISDISTDNHFKGEALCNAVAAEYLTPKNIFLEHWSSDKNIDENVLCMTDVFRVSRWVIARRAYDLHLIDKYKYNEYVNTINDKIKGSGGDYNRNQKTRISTRFATAVATQAMEGRMLLREAQFLTGIRPNKLYAFAQKELGL